MVLTDLFKWTLIASVIFHLFVVLGISFVMPGQSDSPVIGPPLKITLVTDVLEPELEDTDILSQTNSGGIDELASATQIYTEYNPVTNQDASSSEPSSQENMATEQVNDATKIQDDNNNPYKEQEVSREELSEAVNIAYLNSQAQPREKYVSTRSKESKYAAYIEKWRILVERVGNLNYPESAKNQKLEGTLILDVAINHDGSIKKVRVLDSSGYKILDDAAARTVHLAAPFERFPDDIRAEIDVLHIVRTWEYSHEKLTSRNVGNNQ